MRRLAEGTAELAAEVGPRETRGSRELCHVERLPVAGVDQILRTEAGVAPDEAEHGRRPPPLVGGMFWLRRRTFSGSYRRFSAWRRSNESAPKVARTRSIGSSACM